MFLDEGEDPLEVIKEKPKKSTEKSADAGTKSGSAKPAEVKGKVGGAPAQPPAKKTAVLKETQANVIKPAEQNKPREGTISILSLCFYTSCTTCSSDLELVATWSPRWRSRLSRVLTIYFV